MKQPKSTRWANLDPTAKTLILLTVFYFICLSLK